MEVVKKRSFTSNEIYLVQLKEKVCVVGVNPVRKAVAADIEERWYCRAFSPCKDLNSIKCLSRDVTWLDSHFKKISGPENVQNGLELNFSN